MADIQKINKLMYTDNFKDLVKSIANIHHGTFSNTKMTHKEDKLLLDIKVINTMSSSSYDWVEVELQDDLIVEKVEVIDGFVPDTIEVDDSSMKVKLSASDLLKANSEVLLRIHFDGKVNPDAIVALVRLSSGNEIRAFHVLRSSPKSYFPKMSFPMITTGMATTLFVLKALPLEASIPNCPKNGTTFAPFPLIRMVNKFTTWCLQT